MTTRTILSFLPRTSKAQTHLPPLLHFYSTSYQSLPSANPSRSPFSQCIRSFSNFIPLRAAVGQDHYAALKLPRNATRQQVKARFYELSKKYHPDAPGGSPEKFHTINDAYAVLGDDLKRRTYDHSLIPASQSSSSSSSFSSSYSSSYSSSSRSSGPHRAWSGSRRPPPPPLYRHPSSSSRRDPNIGGSGLGFGPGAKGPSDYTSPSSGQYQQHQRQGRASRAKDARQREAAQLEESVKGESATWRFVGVVILLFLVIWLGGGLTANADVGQEEKENGGDKETIV